MEDLRESLRRDRESFRRDLEGEVDPHLATAVTSERAAFDLAQASIRTSILLNGGAFIAIPTIVTLFGLDVLAVKFSLIGTTVLFAGGLLTAWLAAVFGLFALSARAASKEVLASAMRSRVTREHYPHHERAVTWASEERVYIEASEQKERQFTLRRKSAVVSCGLSGFLFVSGAVWGGYTIITAPPKSVPPLNISLPPATPP